jgi:uncharacterized membrane protein
MKARHPQGDNDATINVGNKERILSAALGGFLLFNALSKKDKTSLPKAIGGGYLLFRSISGFCPVYEATGKSRLPNPSKTINIRTTVVVNKPRNEVYAFWRRLENLPLFMTHLESVEKIDERYSHWKAKFPIKLEWKAEIVKEVEGSFLGWSSTEEATIKNAGRVVFADALGGHGTEVEVVIAYRPPLGAIGSGVSKLFNKKFEKMVQEDIRNFKTYIETGIIEKKD